MDYEAINPIGDRLLVRKWTPADEAKANGGVIIRVKEVKISGSFGDVLDVGGRVLDVKPGDKVVFSGKFLETNDAEYLLLKESMVDAILK